MWHPSDTNTTLYLYTITVVQTRLSIYINIRLYNYNQLITIGLFKLLLPLITIAFTINPLSYCTTVMQWCASKRHTVAHQCINMSCVFLFLSIYIGYELFLVQQVCAAERLTRFHLETHNQLQVGVNRTGITTRIWGVYIHREA